MSNEVIIAFIGVAGTIGGTCLGWFLNRDSAPSAQFRTVFTKEIRLLKKGFHKDKTQNIVNVAAVKHENAMIRFRHHISKNKLVTFDAAWSEYKKHTYNSRASNRDIDKREEKAQKELAIKNIEELLEFAK